MSKKLLIVESPAKSKTIQKYLGKNYQILASYGHVRDLPSKKLGIDVDNDFVPTYTTMPDKKQVIKELKDTIKSVDEVLIATDPDREGEAIAWHLIQALKLDAAKTKRVVFNEITQSAVTFAIENPREINQNLVDAQQARRILDRIVGFELSPILWKKVKSGLSAGRVQSVAVRLVVDREREINQFHPTPFFKVTGLFKTENNTAFKAEYKQTIETQSDAQQLLETLKPDTFTISNVEKKPSQRKPSPPFTTATLQQEAFRKLGYSVSQTMMVAQRLYESGLITYMRTDSLHLSQEAIGQINAHVTKTYGAEYAESRQFKTKAKGAQEAHEAIRPTNTSVNYTGNNNQEKSLYALIQKRTIASQMANAKIDRTTATITSLSQHVFTAKGEVITFDGFLKVYSESRDDDANDTTSSQGLPPLATGQSVHYDAITATERFTRHLPRYNEASLVKKLEELGIGRPSTYAPTIATIVKRNYVEKRELEGIQRPHQILTLTNDTITTETQTETTGQEKGKLFPTDIGNVVNDYLVDVFSKIMDYQFTASVEKEFDTIADGDMKWPQMIQRFYSGFHPIIEKAEEDKNRVSGERELGTEPKTNQKVIVRIGRYGPIAQIGVNEDDNKPRFASLLKTQSIETITLEEALSLFEYPRQLGPFEDTSIEAGLGRFGPYLKHANKYFQLKDIGVDDVTLEQAIEIIQAKREADEKKLIKTIDSHKPPIIIQNGPYGPYFSIGTKNFKIPSDKNPQELTLEDCLDIQKNPPKRYKRKKTKK